MRSAVGLVGVEADGFAAEQRETSYPQLIANAVEELLRYLSITHSGRRRSNTPGHGGRFTGAAGDAVLSAPSSYLADLLRERRHRAAWQHALGHARLRHTSAFAVLGHHRAASRTDLAGAWRQTAAELRRPARKWVPQAQRPTAWTPLLASADWMTHDAQLMISAALEEAANAVIEAPARLAEWSD